ncbi:hypothetical protein P3X46_016402 [Hevea brasiliensis]|uniref:UDP-glucose iridoid glucosyltransferase-like n=1 Tax=Hevea brasiliensis TaxID=3981 RepID=A0ABQ9M301_HEVBR|nr:hypothetical protein P3X46_016402 [Hevea brasiliensis]
MEMQEWRFLRQLVLVPFSFQGHLNPMFKLGAILQSKGFSIAIAHAHFNSPNSSNHPNFTFHPISDGISSFTPFRDNFGQDDELPCIIYDGLMYSVAAVTQSLKLPSVVLRASCAANLLTHYAFPSLRKEGYLPVQDSALLDLAPGLHPFRFNDLPAHSFNLDALLWFMVTVRDTGSSSAIIWITMDCLERSSLAQIQKQCQIPLFPIGPMHKIVPASSTSLQEEETSCIRWLDRQSENAVIYITLGCIAIIDANELAEMAWGLANSKQPFLWFVRPGSIRGSNWIELLHEGFKEAIGERGCIVKWAPQEEVLAHAAVGGFWSHCGWNSTPESICEGSPMICRPYFGDQRVITRYASHLWRVGLELENKLEKGEIERAVRSLLVGKEGVEMRQRAMDLKEIAQLSMKKGGFSYNSLNELVEFIASC